MKNLNISELDGYIEEIYLAIVVITMIFGLIATNLDLILKYI